MHIFRSPKYSDISLLSWFQFNWKQALASLWSLVSTMCLLGVWLRKICSYFDAMHRVLLLGSRTVEPNLKSELKIALKGLGLTRRLTQYLALSRCYWIRGHIWPRDHQACSCGHWAWWCSNSLQPLGWTWRPWGSIKPIIVTSEKFRS